MTVFNDNQIRQEIVRELLLLILICFIFSLVGALVGSGIASLLGIENPQSAVLALTEDSTSTDRNNIRVLLLTSHLFIFLLPSFAFAYFFKKRGMFPYLRLHQRPALENLLFGGIILLVALPFALFLLWLNQQIPISERFLEMEENAAIMTKNLLVMPSTSEFLLNLLVIAIIPAIGEELLFRGILQQLIERIFDNPHLGVWIGAIVFSAIHFQFQGFIPRLFLGALLGYFLVWSRNLWVPIFAHFINNGSQLMTQYFADIDTTNEEITLDKIGTYSLVSFIFVVLLAYFMYQFNQKQGQKPHELA